MKKIILFLGVVLFFSCSNEQKRDYVNPEESHYNIKQTFLDINSKYLKTKTSNDERWYLTTLGRGGNGWDVVGADLSGAWLGGRVGFRLGSLFGPQAGAFGAGLGAGLVGFAQSMEAYERGREYLVLDDISEEVLIGKENILTQPKTSLDPNVNSGLRHNQLLFASMMNSIDVKNIDSNFIQENFTEEEKEFYWDNQIFIIENLDYQDEIIFTDNYYELLKDKLTESNDQEANLIIELFLNGMNNPSFERGDFLYFVEDYAEEVKNLYSSGILDESQYYTLINGLDVSRYSFSFWNELIFNYESTK